MNIAPEIEYVGIGVGVGPGAMTKSTVVHEVSIGGLPGGIVIKAEVGDNTLSEEGLDIGT